MQPNHTIRVWDPLVRYGHWVLVAGFFTAYLTEDGPEFLHNWAGYLVAAVVVVRVIWGIVGTRHARFSDFVYRPSRILDDLRDLVMFRSRRYLGHSPAGGAMAITLLVALAMTTFTGMASLAVEEGSGPLAPWFAQHSPRDVGAPVRVWPASEDEENEKDENEEGHGRGEDGEIWEEIHETIANLTLFLVFVHIAGVIFSSLLHRENLVRAMWTGRKRHYSARDHLPPDVTTGGA